VKSLYAPTERMTVARYLKHRYGTLDAPPEHENIWRMELTKQFVTSRMFAISNFFYVANKMQELVLMEPFAGQAMLDWSMESQRRNGLPVRTCSVKARQLGFSLWFIATGLHYCMDDNKRAFILVDDDDVAREQATRLGTMLNGLPSWLQPMRRIQNLSHIVFDNPNPKERMEQPGLNSAIRTTVPASFRGVPPGFVQISEFAHMSEERQLAVQAGIISAMPLNPNSMLVIDTTPNGFDTCYWPMVEEAVDANKKWMKRIESWKGELSVQEILDGVLGLPDCVAKGYPGVFVPAFWPWRLHEEYSCRSKATPRGEIPRLTKEQRGETESTLGKIAKYGGEEEIENRDRFGLSTERAFWRRRKIDGYSFPTQEMKLLTFRQEYLTTVEGAFQDSGTAPFDRDCMDALTRQGRDPMATGLFRDRDEFDHHARNDWQEWRLYAPPQNDERYVMAIDTNIAYESRDSDASVAQIIRYRDRKIVATYEARVPEHVMRQQIIFAYYFYQRPYYAVETKGMGYQFVRTLIDAGLHNVHYWKRYDADIPEPSRYPGWETTEKTRPLMDQTFTALACHRDRHTGSPAPELIITDKKTMAEIRGLTRQPSGAFKASRGHDDHYDALCIALCIADDPYSGLRVKVEAEEKVARQEFDAWFKGPSGIYTPSRSHPDLANI
jgi:hypothetical protein